ncbi:MAG TPA: dienelactone hydrolase [Lacipirellulaceae bacterium]|nr:dienelactone hydrolase [Lacipirellulaceae bacterium]
MFSASSALFLLGLLVLPQTRCIAAESEYDPLKISVARLPKPLDLTVNDQSRSRKIPIRIYLPASKSPAPVVLFSHGLGGTRQGNVYCGEHWAARGYVAVFLQHPGSDDSVWKSKPLGQRMAAMRKAAGLENFLLRAKDVPSVLDQLERWNRSPDSPLTGRLDLGRVGMSGHSFGAVTTEAVSGEHFPITGTTLTDKRIKAAIAFSPSSPRNGSPQQAFSQVKIPWMLMTGTKDIAPIGNADLKSRLAVFPALPPGDKFELVLLNAEHSAFTDRALPGDTQPRNPNHHRVILALSTAFWDAYLRNDPQAKAWLQGDGPQKLLQSGDKWQKK